MVDYFPNLTEPCAFELDKIYCGDCAEVMAGWPDECIDLAVTSPPYDNLRLYNNYVFNFEAIASQLYRVTKRGGVVVWVVADQTINGSETGTSFKQALHFMSLGFNLHDTMIYETDKPPMNDNRYQACFEFMFVLSVGKVETFNPIMVAPIQANVLQRGRYREMDGSLKERFRKAMTKDMKIKESIWYYSSGGLNFCHPAPFPEPLARDHILSWSDPGDIVLDPMCGSGTTLKMAKELGRHWAGIDISQEYCDLSQRRVDGAKVPLPGKWE